MRVLSQHSKKHWFTGICALVAGSTLPPEGPLVLLGCGGSSKDNSYKPPVLTPETLCLHGLPTGPAVVPAEVRNVQSEGVLCSSPGTPGAQHPAVMSSGPAAAHSRTRLGLRSCLYTWRSRWAVAQEPASSSVQSRSRRVCTSRSSASWLAWI